MARTIVLSRMDLVSKRWCMVVKPISRIHQKMQTWVILIKIIIVNDAASRLHVNLTKTISHFHHGSDISFKLSLADPEREGAIASWPGQWSSGELTWWWSSWWWWASRWWWSSPIIWKLGDLMHGNGLEYVWPQTSSKHLNSSSWTHPLLLECCKLSRSTYYHHNMMSTQRNYEPPINHASTSKIVDQHSLQHTTFCCCWILSKNITRQILKSWILSRIWLDKCSQAE